MNGSSSAHAQQPPTRHCSDSSSTHFLYPDFPVWNEEILHFECCCGDGSSPLVLRINQGKLLSHKSYNVVDNGGEDDDDDDDKKEQETRSRGGEDDDDDDKKEQETRSRSSSSSSSSPAVQVMDTKKNTTNPLVTTAPPPPPPPTPVNDFVWAAGALMTKIVFTLRHFVKGKAVLELGSGTGIGGVAAAACGAKKVVMTDLPSALPRCSENVMKNWKTIQSYGGGNVQVETLDWATQTFPDLFSQNYNKSSSYNRTKKFVTTTTTSTSSRGKSKHTAVAAEEVEEEKERDDDPAHDNRYDDDNNNKKKKKNTNCECDISAYPDLIMTADCIYNRELWPLLLRVLRAYSGPKTKILMVEGIRGTVTTDFFEKVKAEFSVVPITSLLQPSSSSSSSSLSQCSISEILRLYSAQAHILKMRKRRTKKNMREEEEEEEEEEETMDRNRRSRQDGKNKEEEEEEDSSPTMIRLHGILTPHECKKLVRSVCKEDQEWNMDIDSVDSFPQDQHDVYTCSFAMRLVKQIDSRVQASAAANIMLKRILSSNGGTKTNSTNNHHIRLIGHFIRRYSVEGRIGFRPHCDSSLFTVNLALSEANVDYEGCGLVVYKESESKRISDAVDAMEEEIEIKKKNKKKAFPATDSKNDDSKSSQKSYSVSDNQQSSLILLQQMGLKPTITTTNSAIGGGNDQEDNVGPRKMMSSVKLDFDHHSKEILRRRTVNISQGDALMHEGHGIYHGVTTITKGTRFVLILFYDVV